MSDKSPKTNDHTEKTKELLQKLLSILKDYDEDACHVALGVASYYVSERNKVNDDPTA